MADVRRRSAEEMLDKVRREAGAGARGRHRVYVGIAPGVGKTYTALEELHRRKERGTDVVIGFIETHGRPKTADLAAGLEVVPRKQIDYKGVTVEEMDTDAVIKRHPALTLVGELAHTNAPAGIMGRMNNGPAADRRLHLLSPILFPIEEAPQPTTDQPTDHRQGGAKRGG